MAAGNEISQLNNNFDEIAPIGKGGYGNVVKARHKLDGQNYAIKIIKVEEDVEVQSEINALLTLDHRNVVKYCNSWQETSTQFFDSNSASSQESSQTSGNNQEFTQIICIQMELCQHTLRTVMEAKLSSFKTHSLFYQICEGLNHIHKNGIIHRDLKPDNIFIAADEYVKIGDFGLSKIALQYTSDNSDGISGSRNVGTPSYAAPEIPYGKYGSKADIYSLGIIYFEMSYKPFGTDMERFEVLKCLRKKTIEFPDDFKSSNNADLIKRLLDHTPKRRPTASKILNEIPPTLDSLQEFHQKIDLSYVSPKTARTYLRRFTRQNASDEAIAQFTLSETKKHFTRTSLDSDIMSLETFLYQSFSKKGVIPLSVDLFLPNSLANFNISTDIRLVNDKSVKVYAIPTDRRICFANYLRNRKNLPITRFWFDTIYEGEKNGAYDTFKECNFDDYGFDDYGIQDSSLICRQIFLQLYDVMQSETSIHLSKIVIQVNHKLLYNKMMEYFKVSDKDRQVLLTVLLDSQMNSEWLKTLLERKTNIPVTSMLEICDIFNDKVDLLQQSEFKMILIDEFKGHVEFLIRRLNEKLNISQIQCEIKPKPLMVPHHYCSGFIYKIFHEESDGSSLLISKGSEYVVNSRQGAGFSLHLQNLCRKTRLDNHFLNNY